MVDTRSPLALEAVPDVRVYPDDASKTVFYALPARPRIAVDEQGRPLLSLVAYGRQGSTGFVPRGGVVTLTTALQLTADEVALVVATLGRRLAVEFPQPEDAPPLVPELRPIDWTGGAVTVTLVPGLTLESGPALYGANQCAFSANIDAGQIGALLDAWHRGLPGATIGYRLTPRTTGGAAYSRHESHFESFTYDSENAGANAGLGYESSVERRQPPEPPAELTFAGPLIPEGTDPDQFLNISAL